MHEVLVNRLGGLSLPRKSVVKLTDRPDMTLDVYCGRKTTIHQNVELDTPDLPMLIYEVTNNAHFVFLVTNLLHLNISSLHA